MPTFTITFGRYNTTAADLPIAPVSIAAEYYKRENGWITFKDANHKVVLDVTEETVRLIETSEPAQDGNAEELTIGSKR